MSLLFDGSALPSDITVTLSRDIICENVSKTYIKIHVVVFSNADELRCLYDFMLPSYLKAFPIKDLLD